MSSQPPRLPAMTLVAYSGWMCITCGHRSQTTLDEPPARCWPDRLALRVLIDESPKEAR